MDRNLTYAAAGNQKDKEESPTWQPTYEPDIPMSGGEGGRFFMGKTEMCVRLHPTKPRRTLNLREGKKSF